MLKVAFEETEGFLPWPLAMLCLLEEGLGSVELLGFALGLARLDIRDPDLAIPPVTPPSSRLDLLRKFKNCGNPIIPAEAGLSFPLLRRLRNCPSMLTLSGSLTSLSL